MNTGEKKKGREADVKWELPTRILVLLHELEAYSDTWIDEYAVPIEFSSMGLSNILRVTEPDCHDAVKPYLTNKKEKKDIKLKITHKKPKENKFIQRERKKLTADNLDLRKSKVYVFLLTSLGREESEKRLNDLKKEKIVYKDKNDETNIDNVEEIIVKLKKEFKNNDRLVCHACIAKFVDEKNEATWNDLVEAVPLKNDVFYQVKFDINNISIKENS